MALRWDSCTKKFRSFVSLFNVGILLNIASLYRVDEVLFITLLKVSTSKIAEASLACT